ncbi:hypothetical cytosolic protein [Syntrophus aciditrophicus SB]|uniref:Hypothetical cytosolic protein n=1 Tax=Syntrophus aciditrophicus (strain SB) TaxID=56780 RepID=Q2LQ46_SYNAS|nr:hypothetical cytosolic protein [Syntrophus aciditrophicus SB]
MRIQKLPGKAVFYSETSSTIKKTFIFHTFYQDNFRQNQLASVFRQSVAARPASDSRLILFLTGAERKAGMTECSVYVRDERRTFSGEGDYDPCCP